MSDHPRWRPRPHQQERVQKPVRAGRAMPAVQQGAHEIQVACAAKSQPCLKYCSTGWSRTASPHDVHWFLKDNRRFETLEETRFAFSDFMRSANILVQSQAWRDKTPQRPQGMDRESAFQSLRYKSYHYAMSHVRVRRQSRKASDGMTPVTGKERKKNCQQIQSVIEI